MRSGPAVAPHGCRVIFMPAMGGGHPPAGGSCLVRYCEPVSDDDLTRRYDKPTASGSSPSSDRQGTKYVIMADGESSRWHGDGPPKHLVQAGGNQLLARTVHLLHHCGVTANAIIVTSHDQRYAMPGARLYAPLDNHREIDRFTRELIEDDVCFLYGDTYYSLAAITRIVDSVTPGVLFLGSKDSIVAVKIGSAALFRQGLALVEEAIANGTLTDGKGWHVYKAMHGIDFDSSATGDDFVLLDDLTSNINTWDDYVHLLSVTGGASAEPEPVAELAS